MVLSKICDSIILPFLTWLKYNILGNVKYTPSPCPSWSELACQAALPPAALGSISSVSPVVVLLRASRLCACACWMYLRCACQTSASPWVKDPAAQLGGRCSRVCGLARLAPSRANLHAPGALWSPARPNLPPAGPQ